MLVGHEDSQPTPTHPNHWQKNKNISGKNVQSYVFRPSSCRRDKFQKGQVLGGNGSSRFSDFGGIKKDSNPKKTREVVNTKKAEVLERTGRFFNALPDVVVEKPTDFLSVICYNWIQCPKSHAGFILECFFAPKTLLSFGFSWSVRNQLKHWKKTRTLGVFFHQSILPSIILRWNKTWNDVRRCFLRISRVCFLHFTMIIFGFRDEMQVFSGGISGCDWPCSSISIAICLICFEGFFLHRDCCEWVLRNIYIYIYIYTYICI